MTASEGSASPETPSAKSSGSLHDVAPLTLVAVLWLVVLAVLASLGGPREGLHDPVDGLVVVVERTLTAGGLAGAVLIASFGFGRAAGWLGRWVAPGAADLDAARWTVGIGLMFSAVHLLGWLGLLTAFSAAALVVAGIALAVAPWLVRANRDGIDPALVKPRWSWLWLLPLAIGVVACASPPGWLWDSEFGGYDVLSYHLQLPREWMDLGRITPIEHNVYSYLPSYAEAGTVLMGHIGSLFSGERGGDALFAHRGTVLHAASFLHLGLGLVAARVIAWPIRAVVGDGRGAGRVSAIAGLVILATPWTLVVGTLAYNELGVVVLAAGALGAALDAKLGPVARGALVGGAVGVACGFKPTALLFVAPGAGVVMAWTASRTAGWKSAGLAMGCTAIIGLVALSPWLVRNAVATGNPVFPQMSGVLGEGHWSNEQHERYAAAHADDAGFGERVRMLVWDDPNASADAPAVERWRGFANPQWAWLPIGAGVAWCYAMFGGAFARRESCHGRVTGALLALGVMAALVAWLAATHLQSRFLLPMVVWFAVVVGVMAAGPAEADQTQESKRSRPGGTAALPSALGVALGLWLTGSSVALYSSQRAVDGIGHPNAVLVAGVGAFSPDPTEGDVPPERLAVDHVAWLNTVLPSEARVYLLGDATPLYIRAGVVYHTTYDRSPLADAVRDAPGDPTAWTAALREAGVTHVLVAPSELQRLTASGWLDPALSTEAIAAWLISLGDPVMAWPMSQGRALYRLPEGRRAP